MCWNSVQEKTSSGVTEKLFLKAEKPSKRIFSSIFLLIVSVNFFLISIFAEQDECTELLWMSELWFSYIGICNPSAETLGTPDSVCLYNCVNFSWLKNVRRFSQNSELLKANIQAAPSMLKSAWRGKISSWL